MDEFEKPTRRTGIPPFGGGSWLRHPPKFLPKETAGGGIAYLIVGNPKYITQKLHAQIVFIYFSSII
jgi:hypothetical protein